MTYSLDFRQKVLKIKAEEGLTFEETAKRFRIGKNSIFLLSKNIEAVKKRNTKAYKIDMTVLAKDVEEHPDAYCYERAQRLGVSKSCVWIAMKRLNITYNSLHKSIFD